ncbi:hypothetical protein AVEN_126935-1 [Araneus ventricosus]|uniref:PiggyBac transposable element-derived protein domain-containing protein n=1 Tax=Araneus ventricosus TaxID=182803 RepID=A0A4Y2LFH3_ARAVE|nr:hypothetical protein AVEN_248571-1 [Araneus ventricosus]GBN12966.1 hypothetical protein AVEN_126935-1 [Araneus ventricosus]
MQFLRRLLAEVESDEDSDFDNEDNGPEDDIEDNISVHENVSEHDTESEEDGEEENEEVNNSEWLSSKDGVQRWKKKFRMHIYTRFHNIVSCLSGTKGPTKDVTIPMKNWELFISDNMIQLIVECTNIIIEKCAATFTRKSGPFRNPCFISG